MTDKQLAAIGEEFGFGTTIEDAGYEHDMLWYDTNPMRMLRATVERAQQDLFERLIRDSEALAMNVSGAAQRGVYTGLSMYLRAKQQQLETERTSHE